MNIANDTDSQLMVMAAHRYCLGRGSYIVGACQSWMRTHWNEFDHNTKQVMVRDTIEALQDEMAGPGIDKESWVHWAEWAWNEMDGASQIWVKRDVTNRGKRWPLQAGSS